MKIIGGAVTKNYNWELMLFHSLRRLTDGLTFFEFVINWDRFEADHSPQFHFYFVLFNFMLFELTVYYRYHQK